MITVSHRIEIIPDAKYQLGHKAFIQLHDIECKIERILFTTLVLGLQMNELANSRKYL